MKRQFNTKEELESGELILGNYKKIQDIFHKMREEIESKNIYTVEKVVNIHGVDVNLTLERYKTVFNLPYNARITISEDMKFESMERVYCFKYDDSGIYGLDVVHFQETLYKQILIKKLGSYDSYIKFLEFEIIKNFDI